MTRSTGQITGPRDHNKNTCYKDEDRAATLHLSYRMTHFEEHNLCHLDDGPCSLLSHFCFSGKMCPVFWVRASGWHLSPHSLQIKQLPWSPGPGGSHIAEGDLLAYDWCLCSQASRGPGKLPSSHCTENRIQSHCISTWLLSLKQAHDQRQWILILLGLRSL